MQNQKPGNENIHCFPSGLTLGLRLPVIGPLRIVDLGGTDVFLAVNDYLCGKLGERFRPPEVMRNLVKQGRLGVKMGGGFYTYTPEEASRIQKERDEWLMQKVKELRVRGE